MSNSVHLSLGILEGDDIGHEIVPASVEIASAAAEKAGLRIDWRPLPIGRKALDEHGHTMPDGWKRLAFWTAGSSVRSATGTTRRCRRR